MTSVGNWDELFEEAEAEHFIGREHELANFQKQLTLVRPRYPIFYISGQGGVGKTTLLNRFRDIARDASFLLTDTDEQQRDIPAVLGRFAQQLSTQGYPLKHFHEQYKTYQQKMHEIENDPEAPQGLTALLARAAVRSAYIVGDIVPGVRKGLEYLPRESVETHAGEWATYLAKKLSNKDEVALVREPTPILTTLFFEDLNEIAEKRKILLCFENFEVTRQELQPWLLRLREYRPSLNIRLAIAGRDQPGPQWDTLRTITLTFPLDIFTEQEAAAFLDTSGIVNPQRRKDILEWSGRLPLFMSWLAITEGVEAEPEVPTHDIVERFLRWVNQPSLRETALIAAIPRTFNLDILQCLFSLQNSTENAATAFDWLQTMPFVQSRVNSWQYHPLVRRMLLHYQRQRSPESYKKAHSMLADFYKARLQGAVSLEKARWTSQQWRQGMLTYLYHTLASDPAEHWTEMLSVFSLAFHKRRTFADELLEFLSLDDVRDELLPQQLHSIQHIKHYLSGMTDVDIKESFALFNMLCSQEQLHPLARGYMFAYRGISQRMNGRYEQALADFEEAARYVPGDAWILTHQGVTYRSIANYDQALKFFDQAIELNQRNSWINVNRGSTYQELKRYEEALADFNRVISENQQDGHALAHRASVYYDMGLYAEALQDFTQALALGEKSEWIIKKRAETYRMLKYYEEALADYQTLLLANPEDAHSLSHRGLIYHHLKRYDEAARDFAQSLDLQKKHNCALLHRIDMLNALKRHEEALTDYEQALAQHMLDFEETANRLGLLYSYCGRYQQAIEVYQRDLDANPRNFVALYNLAVALTRWQGTEAAAPRIAQARTSLQQLLDTPVRGAALYGLAGLDALTGNTDAALDALAQALALEPTVRDSAQSDVAWLDLRTHSRFQELVQ